MKTAIFILILTVITSSAFCKTITVTSSADSGAGTLRQAVLDAESGDVIVFEDSITSVSLVNSNIIFKQSITINGNKVDNTAISASIRHFYLPEITELEHPITITLNNLTLKDGYSPTCGGAILSKGEENILILNDCIFINNSAGKICGALDNNGILIIKNCLFESNTCSSLGVGAILNNGKLHINNTNFINNYGSFSGALYNYNKGYFFVNTSSFKGNSGGKSGALSNRGVGCIVNCLFTDNSSDKAVLYNYKLGIYDVENTSLLIVNTTISDNTGIGVYSEQKTELYNSIIFNNIANYDIYDSTNVIISSNNLLGTSNINFTGNGNILNIAPLFVGNGDYSLQENSPAINQGDNSFFPDTILIDLSGNSRISGSLIDLGAYEYQQISADIFNKYNSNLNIYSQGHTIYVEDALLEVKIYNVMGKLVAEGKNSVFPVSKAGIYIVKADNTVRKIIVE